MSSSSSSIATASDELFELLDLGAADDGSVHARNGERPSERNLSRLLSNLLGHVDHGV